MPISKPIYIKLQNQNDNPGSQHHVQQLICSKAELCLSILRLVVLLGNGVWTTMSGSGHVAAGIPDASQVGGRIPTTASLIFTKFWEYPETRVTVKFHRLTASWRFDSTPTAIRVTKMPLSASNNRRRPTKSFRIQTKELGNRYRIFVREVF